MATAVTTRAEAIRLIRWLAQADDRFITAYLNPELLAGVPVADDLSADARQAAWQRIQSAARMDDGDLEPLVSLADIGHVAELVDVVLAF